MSEVNDQLFYRNPPVPVFWLGWRSDTHSLARAGWEISVSQDLARREMQIAMRWKNLGFGLSQLDTFEYEQLFNPLTAMAYMREIPPFQMQLANHISISAYGHQEPFRAAKTNPYIERLSAQYITEDQFFAFQTIDPKAQNILLAEPSLDEVLEYALKLQEPKQKEMRQKILKDKELAEIMIRRAGIMKANLLLAA